MFVLRRLVQILALVFACSVASAGAGELKNGGFESGGAGPPTNWSRIWPQSLGGPEPSFERVEGDAAEGESYAVIETSAASGYSSFTQTVRTDKKANLVSLAGWVRVESLEGGAGASLLMLFLGADGESLGSAATRSIKDTGDWTRVELEVPLPEGTRSLLLRCGVSGKGRVAFDGVTLVTESLKGEFVPTKLVVHHGTYVVRSPAKCKQPWVALSIPFPFERQSPLAVRVVSDPPDQVAKLEVFEDGENRPLRVLLKTQERDSEVRLRIETLTWVADRELSDGEGVKLPGKRKVPKDVQPHLQAAAGIDLGATSVKDSAEAFDKKDLASLMRGLVEFLQANLKYSAGGSQGAEECLSRGEAVCTGFANSAATLLIASGVPTRILASTQLSGRLQEHYIVEAWTKELGWSRMESTMAIFPWADSNNLILRVVYPEATRNAGDVPIYVRTGGGARGGFWMDPDDSCWQGAETLARSLVTDKEFESITDSARQSFESLTRKPATGRTVQLVASGKARKKLKLGERGERLLQRVDDWIDSPADDDF